MLLLSKKIINKHFIINFLFSFLIISFILGNPAINLNVLLIIITSIFFFQKKIFQIELDYFDKILIILFLYIFLSGTVNSIIYYINGSEKSFLVFFKSIFFFRYIIFYFVIKFLIKENIINFKIFFITAFSCVVFVSFDLIFQFIFGYDIFGYEAKVFERRLSVPFGE